MIPPRLPFPGYKWRWATLTPTEGLNEPPIFLGVLRVLGENQGGRPNSEAVTRGLARVEREILGRVDTTLQLVRDNNRNILRNSQQYWKALGVLAETRGITLTEFGEAVASGRITRDEFAATVVATLELPNRAILPPDEIQPWDRANLRIRPLVLILEVVRTIAEEFGVQEGYLTPAELIRVVIPLAGDNSSVMEEYVISIMEYRRGRLDLGRWPDCAPDDNDGRMAREFLLFLSNYGFCSRVAGAANYSDRFGLLVDTTVGLEALSQMPIQQDQMIAVNEVRASGITVSVERQRVVRSILERPGQARFRRDVLAAYSSTCSITQERIPETLEAAHIIPVEYRGEDVLANSICLRSDIHSLFDSGHLRITPAGEIVTSASMSRSVSYSSLPTRITIPRFLSAESLAWRWNYQ